MIALLMGFLSLGAGLLVFAYTDGFGGPGGGEITFAPPAPYGADQGEVAFRKLQRRAAARGEIALQVRRAPTDGEGARRILLNPPGDERIALGGGGEVVVLTRG